jgi:hypothetical protein
MVLVAVLVVRFDLERFHYVVSGIDLGIENKLGENATFIDFYINMSPETEVV